MKKVKLRRLILIATIVVIAGLYIVLNKDIVQVLDETSVNHVLNEVSKTIDSKNDKKQDILKPNKSISGLFLGSTKDQVIDSLGEPSKKEDEYLNQWYYEESIIYFDSDDLVVGYIDLGELTHALSIYVKTNYMEQNIDEFFIGSSKASILNLLGAPSEIKQLNPDTWKYKNSTIHFTFKDLVDGYMNYYGEIDEFLPKGEDLDGLFSIGSSKEEVMKVMGPPSSIENYHTSIWIYKLAKVYFDDEGYVEDIEDSYGDLKFNES